MSGWLQETPPSARGIRPVRLGEKCSCQVARRSRSRDGRRRPQERGSSMDDNAEAYKFPSSKLSTELARLDEMGFTRSADLTIRASWPTETSEEIEVIERGRVEA